VDVNSEQGVTYTVKELIGMLEKTLTNQMDKIASRLDSIDKKLDDKASNMRAEALEVRLAVAEERVSRLELASAGTAAVTRFQRWIIGSVGVGMMGSIVTLVWLAVHGGH
jgi:hypothetical protein